MHANTKCFAYKMGRRVSVVMFPAVNSQQELCNFKENWKSERAVSTK